MPSDFKNPVFYSMKILMKYKAKMFKAGILTLTFLFQIICYSFSQDIIINSGTSFNVSGGTISLSGDLVNNGTFNDNNGTLVFRGTVQYVTGSTPGVFNNITVRSSSTTTLSTPGQSLGSVLLCDGTLNADGNLTLLSNEQKTAMIDGRGTGEVTGTITMQRYLASGFGYKYFGSPFQDAHVSEFSDNMKLDDPFPAFWKYDESRTTSGWVTYIDPAGSLNPLEGYAINFGSTETPITFDISGVVNNGTLSSTLYNHNNQFTEGFSLVGNPYPSPIDWDSPYGWTRINIDDAVYYFEASTADEYGGTYVTYLNGVSSNGSATNIIPSMQGFFVHVSDGSYPVTGGLTLTNDARITDLTHPLIKSDETFNSGEPPKSLIRLAAAYKDYSFSSDPLVVYFDDKATLDFDGQLDALKLMNTDYMMVNFYLIGPDNKNLSISALPFLTDSLYRIPLGLVTGFDGNVVFSVRNLQGDLSGIDIFLSDLITGSVMDIKKENSFEVYLPAGQYENRFYLYFRNLQTGIDDIEDPGDKLFNIYQSNEILKLKINQLKGNKGRLTLLNLSGQVLFSREYSSTGIYELENRLKSGIYIAVFTTGTGKESIKLFIGNR